MGADLTCWPGSQRRAWAGCAAPVPLQALAELGSQAQQLRLLKARRSRLVQDLCHGRRLSRGLQAAQGDRWQLRRSWTAAAVAAAGQLGLWTRWQGHRFAEPSALQAAPMLCLREHIH
jgi:hypothetical protein